MNQLPTLLDRGGKPKPNIEVPVIRVPAPIRCPHEPAVPYLVYPLAPLQVVRGRSWRKPSRTERVFIQNKSKGQYPTLCCERAKHRRRRI